MPGRTALFVIDPVNDFLSEGGADWDMARSTVEKHEVVGLLKDAIEGERLRRIPVLFGWPMAYTAADYENEDLPPERHQPEDVRAAHVPRRHVGRRLPSRPGPSTMRSSSSPTRGGRVRDRSSRPPPASGHHTPGHLGDDGQPVLRVDRAARHGARLRRHLLRDAIGADTLAAYEASIRLNYPLIGNAVLEVAEFLAAVDAAWARPNKGDNVFGSDHLKHGQAVGAGLVHPSPAADLGFEALGQAGGLRRGRLERSCRPRRRARRSAATTSRRSGG